MAHWPRPELPALSAPTAGNRASESTPAVGGEALNKDEEAFRAAFSKPVSAQTGAPAALRPSRGPKAALLHPQVELYNRLERRAARNVRGLRRHICGYFTGRVLGPGC